MSGKNYSTLQYEIEYIDCRLKTLREITIRSFWNTGNDYKNVKTIISTRGKKLILSNFVSIYDDNYY